MTDFATAAGGGSYQRDGYERYGKRMFDVVFTLLVMPFVLPVIGVLALLVRLDGGPAFFVHERVGRYGELFGCLKLRTMRVDGDEILAAHLRYDRDAREEWDIHAKLRDDPRVTPLGRFLRASSLDELPQFLNVLRGEMSLVGPRPVTSREMRRLGPMAHYMAAVRPGITGAWQVGLRNAASTVGRLGAELSYIDELSFWRDVQLIWKTIFVVLRRTGW